MTVVRRQGPEMSQLLSWLSNSMPAGELDSSTTPRGGLPGERVRAMASFHEGVGSPPSLSFSQNRRLLPR